jgi:uncharacterized protein (DUF433 family)
MPTTTPKNIELRDSVPYVAGTRTKVIEVAGDFVAHGWDVNEIHANYPYLTTAQVKDALEYYHSHQLEMDAEMQRRHDDVEAIRATCGAQFDRHALKGHLQKSRDSRITS